jgi:hypothetical protein
MINKKIKNATKKTYKNIIFKSTLEATCFKILSEEGFNPEYEKRKFVLWEGYYPNVPFYTKDKKTGSLKLDFVKIKDITYTPDITFWYKGTLVVVEIKGFENDVYPYKKKMFRKLMEFQKDVVIFEIFSKKTMLEAIKIIKNEF